MQVGVDLISRAFNEGWRSSLIFAVRLKEHYPGGCIFGGSEKGVAKKLKESPSTVRRHIKKLLELDILFHKDGHIMIRRFPTDRKRLTTIHFNKAMTKQEVSDLLIRKVMEEKLEVQRFVERIKGQIDNVKGGSVPRKQSRGIDRKAEKYGIRPWRTMKVLNNEKKVIEENILGPMMTDLSVGQELGLVRKTISEVKSRLKKKGLLKWDTYKVILTRIGNSGMPIRDEMERLSKELKCKVYFSGGCIYRCYCIYRYEYSSPFPQTPLHK